MASLVDSLRKSAWLTLALLLAATGGWAEEPAEAKKPPVFTATVELTGVPLVPNPRGNVYADCVLVAEARVKKQPEGQKQLPAAPLLAFWGFKDRTLEPAADYEPGLRLEVEVIPFVFADERVRASQKISEAELDGSPLWWVRAARVVEE